MLRQWLAEVLSHPNLPDTLAIVAKTTLIYFFLVLGIRLLGTRELGEATVYDFVLVVVISNAVQNALVGGDVTLVGGLVSAVALPRLRRGPACRQPPVHLAADSFRVVRAQDGRRTGRAGLVASGQIQWDRMRREGVDREELMAALREHGVAAPNDVRLAVLEVDGTISVVPNDARVYRTRHSIRGLRTT